MPGFKTIESKGIHIGTQQFVTLDLTLEVGALEEAVTVEGQATPIETSNASVGSTLDATTLQTLPTAGRNPFYLATTTPGVIPTGDPQYLRQQDQTNSSLLSLGGGPRRGNNYTLDGVAIVDIRNRAAIIPSIESVEELKVQVSTYDAEMGRTGGGVFNMAGKSGANAWHGSLLGQTRPQWGQSLLYFQQKACDAGDAVGLREARLVLLPVRGLAGRPDREGQDVLLGLGRGLQDQDPGQRHHESAELARAGRGLQGERGDDLRSGHHARGSRQPRPVHPRPVPGQRDPGQPDQLRGAWRPPLLAERRVGHRRAGGRLGHRHLQAGSPLEREVPVLRDVRDLRLHGAGAALLRRRDRRAPGRPG